MRLALPVLLLAIACAHPERDLAECRVVVAGAPGRLAACLVSQHNWNPDTAAQAEVAYDAAIRARILRARSESAWVADTMVPQYLRYMQGRNALLRACVARYAVVYNRDGVTPRPHGDESPIDAMVRVCTARFPEANQYPLTPGFFDSLAIIAGPARKS
jgi:hypothetical protein